MNPRVLELLKEPKNIQPEDLTLLKEEINSFPYVQNIRALHLYGVHLHDKGNYQKELATTAAYTTDKKILYQLINGKIEQKRKEPVTEKKKTEAPQNFKYSYNNGSFPIKREDKAEENNKPSENHRETSYIQPAPKPEIKHVYVQGERNRILFDGEENFMNEDNHEVIDLESTLESGVIVTQKPESGPSNQNISSEGEDVTRNTENQSVITHDPVGHDSADQSGVEENIAAERQENHEEPTELSSNEIIEQKENAENIIQEITDPAEVSFKEAEPLMPEPRVSENAGAEEGESSGEDQSEPAADAITAFSSDIIVDQEENTEDVVKDKIADPTGVSFKETEAFMPETDAEGNTESDEQQASSVEAEADEKGLDFTHEKIISEDKINSEKTEENLEDKTELSFHGMDSFLPDVQIQAVHKDQTAEPISAKPAINKHEEEMRRLIEEVEKKMKASRNTSEIKAEKDAEDNAGHEISFAETQSFVVADSQEEKFKETTEATSSSEAEHPQKKNEETHIEESFSESEPDQDQKENTVPPAEKPATAWKPMSFEVHTPDSLIDKKQEIPEHRKEPAVQAENRLQEILPPAEDMPALKEDRSENRESHDEPLKEDPETPENKDHDEQAPVMNVSFFSSDISSWTVDQTKKENTQQSRSEEKAAEATPKTTQAAADSNVPGFINTWQSWLKIDRTQEPVKEKAEIKNKAIEAFIENNPRISQLKEESSFVIKEKNDDISHLMTETLANLYFEQKLYTKAIKAFEILINKYPDKKEYFENRIKEIKDFRTKG